MAKKFTDYVDEAYAMNDYDDIATEHAKYVLGIYIDNLSDGMTMQQAFDQMFNEYLVGNGNDYELKNMILTELKIQTEYISTSVENLKLVDLDSYDLDQYD